MGCATLLYCSFFQHEKVPSHWLLPPRSLIYLEPCGFVHYSMDTPQVRQAQGRLNADLDRACPKLYISWRCSSETCLLTFCHLSESLQLGYFISCIMFWMLLHGINSWRNCSGYVDILLCIASLNSGAGSNLQLCITIENIFCSFSFVLRVCGYTGFLCFWWLQYKCQSCFISCSTVGLRTTDTKYKSLIL